MTRTTAIRWDSPSSRLWVRWLVAAACVDASVFCFAYDAAGTVAELGWVNPPLLLEFLSGSLLARTVLLALNLVGLWQFARRGRLGGGLLALVSYGFLFEAHTARFGRVEAEILAAGAALTGWLAGAALARRSGVTAGTQNEDRAGFHGAVALFAATYTAAGLSKLFRCGAGWMDARSIWTILLAHWDAGQGPRAQLTGFIFAHEWAAKLLAVETIILEVGAVLMLFSPWLRAAWAAQILGFHLSLLLLSGLESHAGMGLSLAFGVPWPAVVTAWRTEPEAPLVIERTRSRRALVEAGTVALCLVALAWTLPFRQWFALSPISRVVVWDPEIPVAPPADAGKHPDSFVHLEDDTPWLPPTPAQATLLADVTSGQHLGDWTIVRVGRLPDGTLALEIRRAAVSAWLELSTGASAHRAPVHAGDLGISITHLQGGGAQDGLDAANLLAKRLDVPRGLR